MGGLPRPNELLRLQRRLRGWSQEDVAAGLHRLASGLGEPAPGVDATLVSLWERGTSTPPPRVVRLLTTLFDLPAEELGIVRDQELEPIFRPQGVVDDEWSRRQFVEKVAALLRTAALPPGFQRTGSEPWERLMRALNQRT